MYPTTTTTSPVKKKKLIRIPRRPLKPPADRPFDNSLSLLNPKQYTLPTLIPEYTNVEDPHLREYYKDAQVKRRLTVIDGYHSHFFLSSILNIPHYTLLFFFFFFFSKYIKIIMIHFFIFPGCGSSGRG
jgi:hypothetical protein